MKLSQTGNLVYLLEEVAALKYTSEAEALQLTAGDVDLDVRNDLDLDLTDKVFSSQAFVSAAPVRGKKQKNKHEKHTEKKM